MLLMNIFKLPVSFYWRSERSHSQFRTIEICGVCRFIIIVHATQACGDSSTVRAWTYRAKGRGLDSR